MGVRSMETATLPEEQGTADDGAPVEEGAEATRSARHLFEYSLYVHAGEGAQECEHATDGKCQEEGHFHAWVCMPNSLQHRDILEKARAAKARRKRALRDAGGDGRPASDAYVTLESDLDDTLEDDTSAVIAEMAGRNVRKRMAELIREVQEGNDKYETYYQDAEEWRRLMAMPEDERPTEELKTLDELMQSFENEVKASVERETEREREAMRKMTPEILREVVRTARIALDTGEAHLNTYYTWLGFIGTRKCATQQGVGTARYFKTLDDFRNASPEAVEEIDNALRELEGRMNRGDASGN